MNSPIEWYLTYRGTAAISSDDPLDALTAKCWGCHPAKHRKRGATRRKKRAAQRNSKRATDDNGSGGAVTGAADFRLRSRESHIVSAAMPSFEGCGPGGAVACSKYRGGGGTNPSLH